MPSTPLEQIVIIIIGRQVGRTSRIPTFVGNVDVEFETRLALGKELCVNG